MPRVNNMPDVKASELVMSCVATLWGIIVLLNPVMLYKYSVSWQLVLDIGEKKVATTMLVTGLLMMFDKTKYYVGREIAYVMLFLWATILASQLLGGQIGPSISLMAGAAVQSVIIAMGNDSITYKIRTGKVKLPWS